MSDLKKIIVRTQGATNEVLWNSEQYNKSEGSRCNANTLLGFLLFSAIYLQSFSLFYHFLFYFSFFFIYFYHFGQISERMDGISPAPFIYQLEKAKQYIFRQLGIVNIDAIKKSEIFILLQRRFILINSNLFSRDISDVYRPSSGEFNPTPEETRNLIL